MSTQYPKDFKGAETFDSFVKKLNQVLTNNNDQQIETKIESQEEQSFLQNEIQNNESLVGEINKLISENEKLGMRGEFRNANLKFALRLLLEKGNIEAAKSEVIRTIESMKFAELQKEQEPKIEKENHGKESLGEGGFWREGRGG
jgi:hypothetical protein